MTDEAPPPRDYTTLRALLGERAPALPKRLKQCAAFALAHPQAMALSTVAEIAEQAGVQPSALVRFSQALGYSGFSELQRVFRTQISEGWPDYRARIARIEAARLDGPAAVLDGMIETAMLSLAELRQGFDAGALEAAAGVLAGARRIHVIGTRRSYPVAAYLGYALVRLGVDAQLVDGVGGMQSELVRLVGPEDAVLAITVTPYASETLGFAEGAAARGARVVAITDGPLSPIAPLATTRLEVAEASLEGFRSTAATNCVAMALVVAVGTAREAPGA